MPMIRPSACRMCQAKDQRIAALEAERDKLQTRLGKQFKRETQKWLQSPAFDTFVDLKHGVVGKVLSALQEGEISRGRAAECLAEIAHGATEVQMPKHRGFFAEDETPVERCEKTEAQLVAARQQAADEAVKVVDKLAEEAEANAHLLWMPSSAISTIRTVAAKLREHFGLEDK
jgi:hypothetical protein